MAPYFPVFTTKMLKRAHVDIKINGMGPQNISVTLRKHLTATMTPGPSSHSSRCNNWLNSFHS